MKLSEIARYWAAKELTAIAKTDGAVSLTAPFAAPGFTLELLSRNGAPVVKHGAAQIELKHVRSTEQLAAGTWTESAGEGRKVVCFDLQKGATDIV
jgi:hypothetical protein